MFSRSSDDRTDREGIHWDTSGMDTAQILLLWDVDHTLIENGGVSKEIYARAFDLLAGHPPTESIQTDGRTDFEIMANLLAANDRPDAEHSQTEITSALRTAMDDKFAELKRRGSVLPGAREVLLAVLEQPFIHQSVLTGNIAPNGRAKLAALDLDQYIDFEVGGFGSDDVSRPCLVGHAQRRASAKFGVSFDETTTVLVGDTVRDVQAAKLGGARVIAVATGIDSVAKLAAEGADVVIDDLRDTAAVLRAVMELVALP
jgi:phosphoglycolate phosphatase-like HAD superfamily hydrolase